MDRRYTYISTIAEYGSILKASEKLYITTSALSKYVQALERQLGVPLFDRVGKRFVLTYAGERYLDWMRKLTTLDADMMAELRDISHAKRGRIRVGVQTSRTRALMNRLIPQFYYLYPNVQLEIHEESSRDLWQMLIDHNLDLALLPDESESFSIEKIPLTDSHMVIVASANSALSMHGIVMPDFPYPWLDINLLSNERFIAPFPRQAAYAPFQEMFIMADFTPNIIMYSKSLGTIIQAVMNNIGITISRDQVVLMDADRSKFQFFCFGGENIRRLDHRLILAHPKDHHLDIPTQSFIELCQNCFSSHHPPVFPLQTD